MTDHVFISYSRRDRAYAQRLAEAIRKRDFPVWLDDRIEGGAAWHLELERSIENSAAVVVIVSSESRKSEWVSRELIHAANGKKRIIPLLLEGEDLPLLVNTRQFVDVRGGKLPSDSFYELIAASMQARRETREQGERRQREREEAAERIRLSGRRVFECDTCGFPVAYDTTTPTAMALLFGAPAIGALVVYFLWSWVPAVAFGAVAVVALLALVGFGGDMLREPSRCPNCGGSLRTPLAEYGGASGGSRDRLQ